MGIVALVNELANVGFTILLFALGFYIALKIKRYINGED